MSARLRLTLHSLAFLFCLQYDATIEDLFETTLAVGPESCDLRICDTGGDGQYAELRNKQLRDANGQTAGRESQSEN